MQAIKGKNVVLQEGELLTKENLNRQYLMDLKNEALLQNFYQEAGIHQNFGSKNMAHGGWEDPSCQLRGHFLGHWLSAAAVHYAETGDEELLAKANAIVHELKICQMENDGVWVASIPEKYFHWIARGKAVWAPHYTVHKTFMGLTDMYRYTGNKEALDIAIHFSIWFYQYTEGRTRKALDDILDFETGGMLEICADLYEFTTKMNAEERASFQEKEICELLGCENFGMMYLNLITRYDRHRLFDPLLEGYDVLTNMHANTTIPEAIGAAKIYEVTGIDRYKKIAEAYWKCAVTERNTFVTGGQTCGEIWTPKKSMAPRLGDKNQEHCTVYNMMRLADTLFRWSKDPAYLDYIERNLYNGIMAQGYFKGGHANGEIAEYPEEGLITYFLPLRGGARKAWGEKTSDFFCCHGSLVQANAAHNRFLYYQEDKDVYVGVYAASEAKLSINGQNVKIRQYRDHLSGNVQAGSNNVAEQSVGAITRLYLHQPDCMLQCFAVETESSVGFTLNLRVPGWVKKDVMLFVNGKAVEAEIGENGFINLNRVWSDGDEVRILLPLSVYTTKLEGSEDMIAYSYGPLVLAGLCDAERILHTYGKELEELLVHDNEREWGSWKNTFKTKYQDPGIRFIPLNQVGYERYQVYFPVMD